MNAVGNASPAYWMLTAQSASLLSEGLDKVTATLAEQREAVEELPVRLRVLYDAVGDLGPVHAGDERLLERMGTSRPWVVAQLKKLEEAGLVRSGRDGRRVVYETVLSRLVQSPLTGGIDAVIATRRDKGDT